MYVTIPSSCIGVLCDFSTVCILLNFDTKCDMKTELEYDLRMREWGKHAYGDNIAVFVLRNIVTEDIQTTSSQNDIKFENWRNSHLIIICALTAFIAITS